MLNTLQAEGRNATPEEQRTLALYVGWGGLAQAFDADNAQWSREFAELKELLTEDEYETARQSTQYAHYTSREIINGIYAGMQRMGFTGGNVLEAGGGVGNFIGLMPDSMRSAGRFTLVERERIAAGIAKALYPRQNVQLGDFRAFGKGDDGYFDAVIGNPPFGRVDMTDLSGRKHLSGLRIHNYFIAKSIDLLREGGLLVNVVSHGFMDAGDQRARQYIAERAELVAAIRLPNDAFKGNAHTEVTTDIVIFRKRPESEWRSRKAAEEAKAWLESTTVPDPDGGDPIPTNAYFVRNPDKMLGEWGRYGTMRTGNMPALRARAGQDTGALLRQVAKQLPQGLFEARSIARTEAMVQRQAVKLLNPPVSEGGHFIQDGKLIQRTQNIAGEAVGRELTPDTPWTEKTTLGAKGFERLRQLAGLRQTVRELLAAELSDSLSIETLRARLNTEYDAYAKDGLLNDAGTARLFGDDPDYPLLASLELDYKPGMGAAAAKTAGVKPFKSSAKKAAIFERRVIPVRKEVERASSPQDALNVSLAERGRLDAEYIGKLLGRDSAEALRELSTGSNPLLYLDPASGEYALRDAYLSGNVRKKLAQARESGMMNNAAALESVLPKDVGAAEISVRIGAPWVPPAVYEDFAKSLLGDGTKARLRYIAFDSSFSGEIVAGSAVASANTYGTQSYPAGDLMLAMLNNREIKVTRRDSDGKTWVDKDATEEAKDKAKEIRAKFQDWAFADPDRAEVLVRTYNDANNNYVTRAYDGSWLTFPGKVPDEIIKFRRHQRNFIARVVQDRTALADHVVGAGKTYSAISAAMELKRTGLANKPMIVVPNHLVKQWAADFYRLYPGANILTASKKDFERSSRRRFLAKIAQNDWDAVIIAHSSFGFVRPSPEFEESFIAGETTELRKLLTELKGSEDKSDKRKVKQIEASLERLDNRLKSLRDKPMDDLLDLEQLGVDQLFVDEAHLFKNLMFSTKMQNIRGLGDSAGSQRAYDMLIKTRQIMGKNGRDQGVVFLTGTPVSNSLAEMYHMMRYLMPTAMKEGGFDNFDAWANTFADIEETLKPTTAGGYKTITAFERFFNVIELLQMFDQVSDTVTMDDIKAAYREENDGREFPLPKLKGGRRQPVAMEMSERQRAYMEEVGKRAEALEARKGPPKKGEDNHLSLMSDARKAAMDIRLVDLDVTEREAGARIDRAASNVFERWQKWDKQKGVQLVFSDLGTPLSGVKKELAEYQEIKAAAAPLEDADVQRRAELGDEQALAALEDAEEAQAKLDAAGPDWLDAIRAAERGFSVYDDMRAALVERGVPAEQIAFIHDYNSDNAKAALFRKVNDGEIRVLLGSTPKMGAGTNVQKRLVALHHLDIPWKPSDVEQREGRIIRQGNLLADTLPDFEAEILAYVTKDTLDKNMWDIQERKIRGINQLRSRQISREIENSFDEMEMSASEMQAAATGNTDLLREIQLRNDITKLERKGRSYQAQQSEVVQAKRRAEAAVQTLPAQIKREEQWNSLAAKYDQSTDLPANWKVEIGGKTFKEPRAARAEALRIENERVTDKDGKEKAKPLDVTVDGERFTGRVAFSEAVLDKVGDQEPIRWDFPGGPLTRRARVAAEVQKRIADALAERQDEVELGRLGDFAVRLDLGARRWVLTVEGDQVGDRQTDYYVDISPDGGVSDQDLLRVAKGIAGAAPNMVGGSRVEMLRRDLASAERTLKDLADKDMTAPWADQGALDALRAEQREIIKRIQAAKAEAAAARAAEAPAQKEPETPVSPTRGKPQTRRVYNPDGSYYDAPASAPQSTPEGGPLFSNIPGRPPAVPGADAAKLRTAVARITRGWAADTAPTVRVIATPADLPAAARRDRRHTDAEGFFEPSTSTIYLVASNLPTEQRALQVLAHEAVGHYGMEAITGPELWGELETAIERLETSAQGRTREALASARRRYAGADRTTFTREAIAIMAELGVQNSVIARVTAALRRFLRTLGFDLKLSEADVLAMLRDSERYLQRGGAGQQQAAEGAFSFAGMRSRTADRYAKLTAMKRLAAGEDAETIRQETGWHKGKDGQWRYEISDDTARMLVDGETIGQAMNGDASTVGQVLDHPSLFAAYPDLARLPLDLLPAEGRSRGSMGPAGASLRENLDMGTARSVLLHELQHAIQNIEQFARGGNLDTVKGTSEYRQLDATFQRRGQPTPVSVATEVYRRLAGEVEARNTQARLNMTTEERRLMEPELTADVPVERTIVVFNGKEAKDVPAPANAEPDGAFSLREPGGLGAAAASDPPGFLARLGALMKPDNLTLMEAIKAKGQDLAPAALGALTLRHIADLGKKYLPQLPRYIDYLNRMQTDRNLLQEEGNALAEKWRGMQRKRSERPHASAMADLMHDATIEGVDPAEEYQPLTFKNLQRETVPLTDKTLRDHIKALRAQMLSRPGDSKVEKMAEVRDLRKKLAQEKRRRRAYPQMVARWNQLPPQWQALYREARDMYAKRSDETLQALIARVGELDMPDEQRRKTNAEIRLMFEQARVAGPYFPLQRFGNYWIAAKNPDTGKRDFFMFESAADQLAAQRDLKLQGYTDQSSGKKLEQARDAFGAGEGFITEVQRKLTASGAPSDLQDEIWQLYLRTLPDLSQRKHMIHRKKVAGYNPDALRAFAANANHAAYQIARLRFGHKMQRLVMEAKGWADSSSKTEGGNAASIYYNELIKRHEWVMNPSDNALVNKISGLGFAWYLGVTPGAAMVNLTQTAIVAGPVLASRFGAAKSMNALTAGMRDSIRTGGNIERTLRDDELRAYQAMRASGAIDKTQAHNLAGMAETDSAQYNDSWHRVMSGISFLFHKAEVVNREATGMAAYRLGRESGMSFDAAVQYAEDIIWESHFDYSNANRARFMQSGAAKVLLMFRQYSLSMSYFLWRNFYQSLKGETPRIRTEARRKLVGVLGMTAVFSGTLGLPAMSMLFGVANAMADAFGEDDDPPFDAEAEFRNFLTDFMGADVARLIARGPVNFATGADIASRVTLDGLWLREPERELEGKALASYWLEQAAGPIGGIFVNGMQGLSLMHEGEWWRGVEAMTPKAIKDGMRSVRYTTEGVNTLRGDALIEDLSPLQAVLQLSGLTPAQINERYDANNAIKRYEESILRNRSRLLDGIALAVRMGDDTMRELALQRIRSFNAANPEIPIDSRTIMTSLKARQRFTERSLGGIAVNPKLEGRAREQGRFAEENP